MMRYQLKRILLSGLLVLAGFMAEGQQDAFVAKVSSYLDELAKDSLFSMSVAISKGDRIVLNKAYGYASRELSVRNTTATSFNIASIGKMFTAVAILQLYDQQKLDLNEKISKYLPDFPNHGICDSVTVRQLLSHTSGLPLWFSPGFAMAPKFDYREMKDYLPLYENIHIDRTKAGTGNYSNVGFMLLGYVVEAVSGMSYKAYLNKHLFAPLKMNHTNLWQLTEIIPNSATGYMRPASKYDYWKTNFHRNMGSSPAGGAYAAANDLLIFLNALKNNRLLRKETTTLMMTPATTIFNGEYGYGINIIHNNGHPVIGHSGEFFGIRGEVVWYKDEGYTVSLLSNNDQTDYNDVSYFIRQWLTGTAAEQTRYLNTQKLFARIKKGKCYIGDETSGPGNKPGYDQELITIKAYYRFNRNELDAAIALFKLNATLFPLSEDAKRESEMAEKRNAE